MKKDAQGAVELLCVGVACTLTVVFTVCLCLAAWSCMGGWGWPWYAKAPAMLLVAPVAYAVGQILGSFSVFPIAGIAGLIGAVFGKRPDRPE